MNRIGKSTMRPSLFSLCLAAMLSIAQPSLGAETIDAGTRASAASLCDQLTSAVMRPGPQPPALENSREKICAQAELKTPVEEAMDLALTIIIVCVALLSLIYLGLWWAQRRSDRPTEIARGRGFRRNQSSSDDGYFVYAGIGGIGTGASSGASGSCGSDGGGSGGDGGSCG